MNVALLPRIGRFLVKPWSEQRNIINTRMQQASRAFPRVRKIDPGFLVLLWDDALRDVLLTDEFEKGERTFVEKFLQPRMTVLDVGASFGIYSLIASMRVGSKGRVIAFEPCAKQIRRLYLNLAINGALNVRVENFALSCSDGEAEFFVALAGEEALSSLRPPATGFPVRSERVRTEMLDRYLGQHSIELVDFIKVDVEGGELDFFKGASILLQQRRAPVILCELQDIRTRAWGHAARDVANFVKAFGYRWFKPMLDGTLEPMPDHSETYDGNYVAVPAERVTELKETIRYGPGLSH